MILRRSSSASSLPFRARDAAHLLDAAFDGCYELIVARNHISVRNPASGKETTVKLIDGYPRNVVSTSIPMEKGCVEGEPPKFLWNFESPDYEVTPMSAAIRRVARIHEKEMIFGDPYGHVDLTEEEQSSLDGEHMSIVLKECQFVAVGDGETGLMLIPVAPGWLSATMELSLRHPMPVQTRPALMLESRYEYFAGKIGECGIPADAIHRKDSSKPDRGRPTLWVTIDGKAVKDSGLIPTDGKEHEIDLDGITCLLFPCPGGYGVKVIDSRVSRASVTLCSKVRSDVLCARIQSGKPVAETKGAKLLMEYLERAS